MACLGEAMSLVDAFCAAHVVPDDDRLRLALFVEELFTNTVTHGHGGDSDATVRIGLVATAGEWVLLYADGAPAFDPLARAAEMRDELEAELADRPVGHLGLPLLLQMAHRVAYRQVHGRNRLILALERAGG
jgi:anti-sigma regulatory factor (Ser/Thr protein kinase)